MGSTRQGTARRELLRERAARCDGGGSSRRVWDLLRDHRRTGVCLAGLRRSLDRHRARSAAGAVGRGANADMSDATDEVEAMTHRIRVVLPAPLRALIQ